MSDCPPCIDAIKHSAARPRKSVMGDGKGYTAEDLAYTKDQDNNAPKVPTKPPPKPVR